MKKQAHTTVDEYVRQREPEIPVTFDPEDWNRLAAELDAAAVPQPERTVPPLPAPKPKSFRGVKGWWVSGIWVLALLGTTWVLWQRVGHTHAVSEMPIEAEKPETEVLEPAPSGTTSPSAKSSGAALAPSAPADQGERPAGAEHARDASVVPSDLSEGAAQPEGADLNQTAADSTHRLPAFPADSARTEKKKKHLFW